MNYEKPTLDFIHTLRHGNPVTLFDPNSKLFYHIQINKKAKHICWQRYASIDRKNWIEYNYSLSLREVLDLRAELAIKQQRLCFKKEVA
jgi:hypothetical protein